MLNKNYVGISYVLKLFQSQQIGLNNGNNPASLIFKVVNCNFL